MRIRKTTRGEWFYDFTFNKKRFRVCTGLSKDETEDAGIEHYRRLKRGKYGLIEDQAPASVSFEDFADEFLEKYSKPLRRPKTVLSHRNSINRLEERFKGKDLADITAEMIDRYKIDRSKSVSIASVNREIACLKKMFAQAVDWGKVKSNPASRIKLFKEYMTRERILTNGEIARLIESSSPHLRPILIVALNTGMRKNEILTLKWKNVNFAQRQIVIEDIISKSRRSRKVPMNEEVIRVLKTISRAGSVVFYNPETKKGFNSVRTAFKTACKKAKIGNLRFHDLRHTAATKMIEAGVDIVTVSKILGHASIEITYQRYCHPSPEGMQLAVERLGVLYKNALNLGKNPGIEAKREGALTNSLCLN